MQFKRLFNNIKDFLLNFLSLLIIVVYIFLVVWTYCYSLYVCYLLIAAFAACGIIYFLHRSKRQAVKFLLLGLFLLVVLSPFNIKQYNRHAAVFQERINKNSELTNKEKLGIYGSLIMVTMFDIIPFREVGIENFYLFFPASDGKRFFNSNSILNSPSILRAIQTKKTGYIYWNRWNYVFNKDFRYSIAFNPCTVNTIDRNGYKEVTLVTSFGYRKNYVTFHATHFLNGLFMFRIDEGLFWYLQQRGWLHPYTAVWKAKMKS